jgi:hypothetical protein
MTWAKLDDGFWMHPKVVMGGNEAAGIFARCLSYCGKYLTDGRVPAQVALSIAMSKKALDHTVACGFLQLLPSGDFYVRDYADYNPLRDEVEAKRTERSEKAQKAAEARWAKERQEDAK